MTKVLARFSRKILISAAFSKGFKMRPKTFILITNMETRQKEGILAKKQAIYNWPTRANIHSSLKKFSKMFGKNNWGFFGPWKNRFMLVTDKIKWPYLRLHTTYALHFCYGKNTENIYYYTANKVRGLCVGEDMVILFFAGQTQNF